MFFRKLFRKNNEINPFSVTDRVTFRNVDRTVELTVRGDASVMVATLRKISGPLDGVTNATEEEQNKVAHDFAEAIFGAKQAEQLFELYDGNPISVITACGMYFRDRLSGKITKAQKKPKK